MNKRTIFELLIVVLLAMMAIFSMTVPHQNKAHYALDHNKIIYDGSTLKGKFSGQGHLKLTNKDKYVGNFKGGQFDGSGTFYSHDKWKYQGKFVDGIPSGKGVLTTANHHRYSGTFVKGEFKHAD